MTGRVRNASSKFAIDGAYTHIYTTPPDFPASRGFCCDSLLRSVNMYDRDNPAFRTHNMYDTDDFNVDNFVPESPARTNNSTPSSEGGALWQPTFAEASTHQPQYDLSRSQTPGARPEQRMYTPNGIVNRRPSYANSLSHGSYPMNATPSAYSSSRSQASSFHQSSLSPSVHTTAILQRLEQLELAVKAQNTKIESLQARFEDDILNDADSECVDVPSRRRRKKARKEKGDPLYILSEPLRHLDATQKSVRLGLQVCEDSLQKDPTSRSYSSAQRITEAELAVVSKLNRKTIGQYLPETAGEFKEDGKTYLRPDLTKDVDDPINARLVDRVAGKVYTDQTNKVINPTSVTLRIKIEILELIQDSPAFALTVADVRFTIGDISSFTKEHLRTWRKEFDISTNATSKEKREEKKRKARRARRQHDVS